jgi:hypothetical protein
MTGVIPVYVRAGGAGETRTALDARAAQASELTAPLVARRWERPVTVGDVAGERVGVVSGRSHARTGALSANARAIGA